MFNSPLELNNLNPAFSKYSKFYQNYIGPLFKGYEVGNYELLQSFPDSYTASNLPREVAKYFNFSSKPFVGAYNPVK
jgi:hypothetical protein